LLPPCCGREAITVREPSEAIPPDENLQWHQDGGGPLGGVKHMVIWSSEMPTELRLSTGEIYPIEPFDMVWYDNWVAFHRQPANTRPRHRWFVAVACGGTLS
jgi:hypothetical protein